MCTFCNFRFIFVNNLIITTWNDYCVPGTKLDIFHVLVFNSRVPWKVDIVDPILEMRKLGLREDSPVTRKRDEAGI